MTDVVKSAGRVLTILEYFDQVQREVTVMEIVDRLGYPQSSTSMLMHSLVELGYLYFDRKRRSYGPTTRAKMLGNWVHGTLLRDGRVLQIMHELNRVTGETIVLAAVNGVHAQYIRIVQEANNTVKIYLRPGTLRPLFRSGTGLLLLSAMPDEEVRRLAHRANAEAKSSDQAVKLDEVLPPLAEIRRSGYVFSRGLVHTHVGLLGILLPAGKNDRPLAIGMAALLDTLDRDHDWMIALIKEKVDYYLT